MNKLVLVVVAVAALGCRPPSWKSRAKNLHAKITAVVPRPALQIDPDVAAALVAAAAQQQQQQQQQQHANHQPEPAPADRPRHTRPTPDPIVKRTEAPPASYVLRGETIGGKKICTKFSSMDECNAECTRQIRAGAMAALSKDAGFTKSCVCVDGNRC